MTTDRRAVWAKTGGACYLCGRPLDPADWHVEHIIPRSRRPDLAEAMGNLAPACPPCNLRKSARLTHLPPGPTARALALTATVAAHLGRAGFLVAPLEPVFGPTTVTLRFAPAIGHAQVTTRLVAEARAACAEPAAWVRQVGSIIAVDITRARRMVVAHTEQATTLRRIPIGQGPRYRTVALDLDRVAPHVLVAGATGSGKSEALATIAYQLAHAGADLAMIDLDGTVWPAFERLQAARWRVAASMGEAAALLAEVLAFCVPARTADARPLALLVDETAMLMGDPTLADALMTIAERGRKHAIHLVAATQYPDATTIPRRLSTNCEYRLAGRVRDETASKVILGSTGAQLLAGRGDMLLACAAHRVRVQVALTTPADLATLPIRGEPAPEPASRELPKPTIADEHPAAVEWTVRELQRTGRMPARETVRQRFRIGSDKAARIRDAAEEMVGAA